ncbi:MAG: hypothetical protein K0R38_1326 [Polyangiaceae bacterium]|jgi:hypothetical protein|nr:hypothetical protein [Polyangiaceae bacterium]
MTWLLGGLFASTFLVVAVTSYLLDRDATRAGLGELQQAAATFGLSEQPRSGWSSEQVFHGAVQHFELTWTITPKRIGRGIVLRLRHPKLKSGQPSDAALAGMPDKAYLTFGEGFVQLSFEDTLGNDASQVVPATRRLLALAGSLLDGM